MNEVDISYTVKELLSTIKTEQTQGFLRLERNMQTKANKTEIAETRDEIRDHNGRLLSLEQKMAAQVQTAKTSLDNRTFLLTAAVLAVMIIGLFVTGGH